MYSKEDGPIEHVKKQLLHLLLPSPLLALPSLQEDYHLANVKHAVAALNAIQDMKCRDKDVPEFVSRREHLHMQDLSESDDPLLPPSLLLMSQGLLLLSSPLPLLPPPKMTSVTLETSATLATLVILAT